MAFGLVPRSSLEIPGGERRLDRILALISGCNYSFHEAKRRRLLKSLSDLAGTDVQMAARREYFESLENALVRVRGQPTVQEMRAIHRHLKIELPGIQRRAGTRSLFEAHVLADVLVLAGTLADEIATPAAVVLCFGFYSISRLRNLHGTAGV